MKKIIYVKASTDSLTLDLCEHYKNEAIPIVSSVFKNKELRTPEDQLISVEILIDAWAQGKPTFVNASAKDLGQNKCLIELGVGQIARLSVTCRAIAADSSVLKGHRGKLMRLESEPAGHEKILGDFAFNYMLTFLCWHEVAHILYGHLDWLAIQREKKLSELNNPPFSAEMLAIRRALEGDADRHAAKTTAAVMDVSLSHNDYLQYANTEDIFTILVTSSALFSSSLIHSIMATRIRRRPILMR